MDREAVQEDLDQLEEELDREDSHLPDVALAIPVSELLLRNHETICPDATIRDAIDAMLRANVGCLPVVEDGRLTGIVTERNILHKVAPEFDDTAFRTVREIMVSRPTSIHEDATVETAIRLMHKGHFRHLPIVDADNRVTGTLSVRNIMEYLIEHFAVEVLNLPPHPIDRGPTRSREGA